MENGSSNQGEEIPLILTTSSPVNQCGSKSAHSIKETDENDENAPEIKSQWQQSKAEGPPTSHYSDRINEDSVAESVQNEEEGNPKITFHQKIIFFSIAIASLGNVMSFSILTTFFPVEAKTKGMSQTVIGLVFCVFAFSSSVGSPICGKFLPLIGARFVFLAGSFLAGGSNILFGFLGEMPNETTFTVYCFLLRIAEGVGSAATFTAASAILAHTFPDNVGTVLSVNELVNGIGLAVGPAIGGLLFNAGGFRLPFFVLGGFDLLIVAVNFFIMPQQGFTSEKLGSLVQVLTIPAMWLALIVSVLGSAAFGFVGPTLSIHLKELTFDVIEISLMFTLLGGMYGLSSVLWGYIADKKKATMIMLVFGAFGCAVFFLFIGPSPILKMTPQKYITGISVVVGGTSMALLSMPTLVDMFITSEWYGLSQGLGDTSVISGLWVSSFYMGTMLGPLIGGVLTDHLGFDNAGTVLSGVYITAMFMICLFGAWEYRCGKGRREPKTCLQKEP